MAVAEQAAHRHGPAARLRERAAEWRNALVASPRFQAWARRFPLTRPVARRDAERLYDIVSGFVYSQTLLACVELDLFARLAGGARSPAALAAGSGVEPSRMTALCQGAAALGLMIRLGDGRYALGRLGAAVLGVPGLAEMIRHHRLFYGDIADPVALLRGEARTALADFWPYVRGERAALPGEVAESYSDLMASSQALVAEETLRAAPLRGVGHLLDVGGGSGAFLAAVAARYPAMRLTLFDLPEVARQGEARFAAAGLSDRAAAVGGSFLDDPLPAGAGAISLVRVLYDHDDAVVHALLEKVFAALPPGGLLLVSEPMSGGVRPRKAGDAYFGLYTMAMTTGRPRSAETHARILGEAGFARIRRHRAAWPFITGVITARKPGEQTNFTANVRQD